MPVGSHVVDELVEKMKKNLGGGGYLAREVTGVCGKSLHTLYPVAVSHKRLGTKPCRIEILPKSIVSSEL